MKEAQERADNSTNKAPASVAGVISAGAGGKFWLIIGALASAALLAACNEKDQLDANGALTSSNGGQMLSVQGTMIRPKLDPKMIEQVKAEEQAEIQKRLDAAKAMAEAAAKQQQQPQQQLANADNSDPSKRDLPPVDTSPISGIANMLGFGGGNQNQPGINGGQPSMPSNPASPPPQTYSYGGYGQPTGGSLIPPPPAISVTATMTPPPAAMAYGGGQYYPPPGYPGSYAPPPYYQPPPPAAPAHPAGSMFGSGNLGSGSSAGDGDEAADKKKQQALVLITPTGMDARSPYKQRDDLKILIKGALANAKELREDKIQQQLTKTDVGLPAESTKGNISLTQRQIDNLFKTPQVDKKIAPAVKKVETDLAQAYYRYLYAFNKYALTQQQVAARKQQVDVAEDASEKQRAAADLASAQNDADTGKEDLSAAQMDLATVAGARAARSVITKVAGVAPSLDSLAAADSGDSSKSIEEEEEEGLVGTVASALNPMNVFGVFGHHGREGNATANGDKEKAASAASGSSADQGGKSSKDKQSRKVQEAADPSAATGAGAAAGESAGSPAAVIAAAKPATPIATAASKVTFELKNVQTTPRKSVLKVSIRNNSGGNINIDADAISVAEGDRRLADAAVNAEFEAGMVQPNQEVSGTITIFGRPWNDRLTVSLSEGGKTIQLHR